MRILALIPARGGSKRLPGKNIRPLGGKPLIAWSIEAASGIPEICDVLVSTDDCAIANAACEVGALVPWLRPAHLASDNAASIDVALHALAWYESAYGAVDGLLLLQPTSPFRSGATMRKGITMFEHGEGAAVLGVSPCPSHPMWTLKLEGGYLVPFLPEGATPTRSQDLPPAFVVNGAFYLISPAELRARRSFIGAATLPLLIESTHEAIDIDTAEDWALAESALAQAVKEEAQHEQRN